MNPLAMGLQMPGAMRPTMLLSLLILSTPAFAQSTPALAQPVLSAPAFGQPTRQILLVDSGSSANAAQKMQVRGAFFMGAGIVHLAASTIATGFAIDNANFLRHCHSD